MQARTLYNQMFLTVTEVARRLNVSRGTVYKLMRQGYISYVQLGGVRRIPAGALAILAAVAMEEAAEKLEETGQEGE